MHLFILLCSSRKQHTWVWGSTDAENDHIWHLTLMRLTFCPFIPPAPSAPGWPCGRRPWLMDLWNDCSESVTAGKYVQGLLSPPFLLGLQTHPSPPVCGESRSLTMTDSSDRRRRRKAGEGRPVPLSDKLRKTFKCSTSKWKYRLAALRLWFNGSLAA